MAPSAHVAQYGNRRSTWWVQRELAALALAVSFIGLTFSIAAGKLASKEPLHTKFSCIRFQVSFAKQSSLVHCVRYLHQLQAVKLWEVGESKFLGSAIPRHRILHTPPATIDTRDI